MSSKRGGLDMNMPIALLAVTVRVRRLLLFVVAAFGVMATSFACAAGVSDAVRVAPPLASRCATTPLVDAQFRDAALVALDPLIVNAPGGDAHGAVRSHQSAGFVDASGQAWQQVSAYVANLGLIGVLRISSAKLPAVGDWLRWQARHMALTGPTRGVVLDHWLRAGDLQQSTCPAGIKAALCNHVDAYDSTASSLLILAQAYSHYGGEAALLRERELRAALEAAVSVLDELSRPDGLTLAKPDHPVAYLMDAVETAAGWRAWAQLQRDVYGADAASVAATLAKAGRVDAAIQSKLWDSKARQWRVHVGAGPANNAIWYPDTVAQAWPMLWSGTVDAASFERMRQAWRDAAKPWRGGYDWASRNVDPDGFWWPAAAVAAQCVGEELSARAWVARARERWLQPAKPFAWPFQVSDLLWLLWLAEPSLALRVASP